MPERLKNPALMNIIAKDRAHYDGLAGDWVAPLLCWLKSWRWS